VDDVVINFDGSCEPRNPGGTMGVGVVMLHRGTEWTASHAIPPSQWPYGQTTNNVAEYLAFIAALDRLMQLGMTGANVEFRGDSMLVIRQMFGRWKIKNGAYAPLAREARLLLRNFSHARGRWIPRHQNHVADKLSNQRTIKINNRQGGSLPAGHNHKSAGNRGAIQHLGHLVQADPGRQPDRASQPRRDTCPEVRT